MGLQLEVLERRILLSGVATGDSPDELTELYAVPGTGTEVPVYSGRALIGFDPAEPGAASAPGDRRGTPLRPSQAQRQVPTGR